MFLLLLITPACLACSIHATWGPPFNLAFCNQIFPLRFVKCRDIHFAHQVHREKAPTMAYQYLWGSKALNIANNTVYSQVGVNTLLDGVTIVWGGERVRLSTITS